MKNKFTHTVKLVIGWSILVLLAVGGIGVIGYIVALIAGGDVGAAIVNVINNQFYVWITRITCGLVVVGMILVYITGEHDFILASKKKRSGKNAIGSEPAESDVPESGEIDDAGHGAADAVGSEPAESDGKATDGNAGQDDTDDTGDTGGAGTEAADQPEPDGNKEKK